ncbi:MAG: serine/threonine protein kinase [Desulfobulbaceae bacterium]|uniref:Serine/threonine protein kinase n=1 Tax=Candidatus Desulfobia pelagia TaxID=2841692 RepID=A0A8J6NE82_9BACT|nr:serine/threonine protein kinase [Candidatus Desulfobia pelagia]
MAIKHVQTVNDLPPHVLSNLRNHPAGTTNRTRNKIFYDTSDFTSIDYGDIIFVDDRYFLIVAYTKEGRFGIDEQTKPWVPKVLDLESGERFIVKLVFHEQYELSLGGLKVTCYRNPEKEARVLELVRDHPHSMHGYSVEDEAGNLVRILDIISGKRLDKYVYGKSEDHREYFEKDFPSILASYLKSVETISFFHKHGFKHGDIRRDHILVDYESGLFRWIDYDYDFFLPERPFALDLFGLGNILLFLAGRQTFRRRDILQSKDMGEKTLASITDNDLSLLSKDRIYNLQKIFPYIPDALNNILLHFTVGAPLFYDSVDEFYGDLAGYYESL